MIKQAEVQNAYLQGRQAAMTKIALSVPIDRMSAGTTIADLLAQQAPLPNYDSLLSSISRGAGSIGDSIQSGVGNLGMLAHVAANNPNARLAAMGLGGLALGGGLGYLANRGERE